MRLHLAPSLAIGQPSQTGVVTTRRFQCALAAVGVALLAGATAGGQTAGTPQAVPRPGRFEATILAGYRMEGSLTAPAAPGTPILDFGNAATFGLALDWQVDRYGDLEIQYGYTNSPATATASSPDAARSRYDIGIHDVTFGILANFVPAGRRVRPYFGLALGFVVLVPSNELPSTTKLTFSLAGGVRAYFSEHFGARLEIRWAPAYLFSTGPGTCDWLPLPPYYCVSNDTSHVIEQTDFRLGAIFRF